LIPASQSDLREGGVIKRLAVFSVALAVVVGGCGSATPAPRPDTSQGSPQPEAAPPEAQPGPEAQRPEQPKPRPQKLTSTEKRRVAEAQVWIADACAKSFAYARGDGRQSTKREFNRLLKGVGRLEAIARRKPRARFPGVPTMKDVLYASASDLEERKCDPPAAERLEATARSLE
jgi:hypothetical protein